MNILVTNVHSQQAFATIRAMRPITEKIVVSTYVTDALLGRISHGAYSRLVDKRYPVPSPVKDWLAGNVQRENSVTEEAYVQAMLNICEREKIDAIFPSWDPDVYVLSKNKDRFASMGVLIPVPDYDVTLTALDKHLTIKAAEKIGFPCPRTYLYENEEDVRNIVKEEGFPLVIKPRFTSGGKGMAIVNNMTDLFDHLKFEANGFYKPIIQEYIPGGEKESLQFVIDTDGNPAFAFHKKRLRTFRVNSRFGTVSKSATLPPYFQQATRLMQSFGWWGAGGLEVLIDPRDGSYKLMEINARYPRQLWNRTEMGINEPGMCLDIARGKKFPTMLDYEQNVLFVNPVEDVMLLGLQIADVVAYRFRRMVSRKKPPDSSIEPQSMSDLISGFIQTYRSGQKRVLDPYTRHFFKDPLVALIWWVEFTTWIGGGFKKIGR